ncbi:hypothetical protein [Parasitella parasitica]|uniref:WWE domain-containing protein n=1 Tax=Parasitella parasitica TaxID=35722 RepID=A0A0B7NBW7_9FUNG|nr:hypothetical protein [Parasitella parasitica]
MNVGPELSIVYHHNNQQYYNSTPLILSQHQQYRIPQEASQQQKSLLHDQMIKVQHNKQQNKQRQQEQSFSPPLSVASSSSTSSGSNLSSSPPPAALNYHISSSNFMLMKKKLPATFAFNTVSFSEGTSSIIQQQSQSKPAAVAAATWNFTWLVFMSGKWVPFDALNQTKLEQTLTVEGTFVDIKDSHFPDVKRVRVFPKSNYLSYLGVKYRLSRIMQPDAYLDHVGIAEAKKPPTLPLPMSSSTTADKGGDNRLGRAWEM